MPTSLDELGISMRLSIKASWVGGESDAYMATVDGLNILALGNGDEDSMKGAVEDEIEFLINDMSKDSLSPLLYFLLTQGVDFTIGPPRDQITQYTSSHDLTPTSAEGQRLINLEHHGRVRIDAIA